MSYKVLLTILNRDLEGDYREYFRRNQIGSVLSVLANGTASKSVLDYLGIEKTEKIVMQSVVASAKIPALLGGLVTRMGINLPGAGIAMSVPLESIGGSASLKALTQGQEITATEEAAMKENVFSLILVISDKGRSDLVMDAARAAGARGGTVVHGKGTANEQTARFLGVAIAPEKELIYIATRRSDKDAIMRSILEHAGPKTPAKAICFSLPVDDVVGLTTLTDSVGKE